MSHLTPIFHILMEQITKSTISPGHFYNQFHQFCHYVLFIHIMRYAPSDDLQKSNDRILYMKIILNEFDLWFVVWKNNSNIRNYCILIFLSYRKSVENWTFHSFVDIHNSQHIRRWITGKVFSIWIQLKC